MFNIFTYKCKCTASGICDTCVSLNMCFRIPCSTVSFSSLLGSSCHNGHQEGRMSGVQKGWDLQHLGLERSECKDRSWEKFFWRFNETALVNCAYTFILSGLVGNFFLYSQWKFWRVERSFQGEWNPLMFKDFECLICIERQSSNFRY